MPRAAAARLPPEAGFGCEMLAGESRILRAPSSELRLDELELDGQLDVVGDGKAALRERGVPVEAELSAVDNRLEREAKLGDVAEGYRRPGDLAASLHCAGVALDRQLAVHDHLIALAPQRGRAEADLRVALDVEEIGRAEMALEVRVLDHDRAGVHGADELGGPRIDGQGGVELLEPAAERGYAHVLDGEAGRRVSGIEVPGPDRKAGAAEGGVGY